LLLSSHGFLLGISMSEGHSSFMLLFGGLSFLSKGLFTVMDSILLGVMGIFGLLKSFWEFISNALLGFFSLSDSNFSVCFGSRKRFSVFGNLQFSLGFLNHN
jgi:hypothetical protein